MLLLPLALMNPQWWLKINKKWKYCKTKTLRYPLGNFLIFFFPSSDFAVLFHVTCSRVISITTRKALYSAARSSQIRKTKGINSDKGNTGKNQSRFATYSLLTILSPATSAGMQNDLFVEKCCPPSMFFCIFYIVLMKSMFSPFWLFGVSSVDGGGWVGLCCRQVLPTR